MPRVFHSIHLVLLTCVMGSIVWQPAYAQEANEATAALVTLETRIAVDADSCPMAVEVWLTGTTDTIQALQLAIAWDRPDFARFKTDTIKNPVVDTLTPGDSSGNAESKADSLIIAPVLNRADGLLVNWEYVEARGENGLSAKITAFPYLTVKGDGLPLAPSDSGLLFSLPVEALPKPPVDILGDSASIGLNREGTLLSDEKGKLIDNIVLRSGSMRATACWSSRR